MSVKSRVSTTPNSVVGNAKVQHQWYRTRLVGHWWISRVANIKPIYECRCNGRLQTKRSTWLSYTGLVVELEHLKIKTRLTNDKFANVKGEYEI
jgi:hypothetical protein